MVFARLISVASRVAPALAVGLFLTLSPTAPADAGSGLSSNDLAALFPGRFQAQYQGNHVTLHARDGGELIGYSPAGSDSGRWSVQGGQLCVMLNEWLEGRTMCSTVIEAGGWYRADRVLFRKI